ncbi:hypothetical protein FF098_009800 [Parvularcula flava]|uniref:Anti-sigma factor NepR domain-containing protein n=1 Tax=Aquisalinus luteolus TaxID=1566827 RepID=A0A8J3EPH4_9PROT|nr:hypothetical protein [Aquisalinus luteolus]NHK28196.1 hypothetical protein [Aquisalinus luteolus]GGH97753.1 hypothetical protein GCM10011355_19730 [Aquisalinus luteolus]
MSKDRHESAARQSPQVAETVLKQYKKELLDAPLPEPLENLLAGRQKNISQKPR